MPPSGGMFLLRQLQFIMCNLIINIIKGSDYVVKIDINKLNITTDIPHTKKNESSLRF